MPGCEKASFDAAPIGLSGRKFQVEPTALAAGVLQSHPQPENLVLPHHFRRMTLAQRASEGAEKAILALTCASG